MKAESSPHYPAGKPIGGKADSVRGVADLKEIARFALDTWAERLEQPARPTSTSDRADSDFSPATLWRIRQHLQELTEGDAQQFIAVLNRFLQDRGQLRGTLVVWIDLIDTLVHQAERRYPLPGRGQLKRSEVKSAIVYLLRRQRLDIPGIPDFLEPVIVDLFADFTLNAIVALTNDNGLWDLRQGPDHPVLRGFKWILFRFWRFIRPAVEPIGRLFTRIYLALRYPTPISPALRQALEAVSRDSLVASRGGVVKQAVQAKVFVGEHAASLVAGVRLVGIVVQEAEKFASLSGPEKKRYAMDLIFELLSELGLRTPGPLMELVIEYVAGFAVDATVDLFNKRGLFPHPSGTRLV